MICCKDCPNRHIACWDRCETYLSEKKKEAAQRSERQERDAYERQYLNYTREFRTRYKKRIGEK